MFLLLPLIILLLLVLPSTTTASSFSSSYHSTYIFNESGRADVTHTITFENLDPEKYLAEYSLITSKTQIEEVKAQLNSQSINTSILQQSGQTIIKTNFEPSQVAKQTQLELVVNYKSRDFAHKNGRIWEVNIPTLSQDTPINFGDYSLEVRVPKDFGPLMTSFPKPDLDPDSNANDKSYQFNAAKESTITLSFGDYQVYNLKLNYHLYNPWDKKARLEIALPPNLPPYQTVYYQSLNPSPNRIHLDGDGNYLAEYTLGPKEVKDITFEGQATVTIGQGTALTNHKNQLEAYLVPAKYWEVNDTKIKEQKSKIKDEFQLDENSTASEWARAIYEYVIHTLTYNPQRITQEVNRLGALGALEAPDQAVCMEFTDLTIALMRAVGIPAREIDGFAYTGDVTHQPTLPDSLHSWVQIYLSNQGWVNLDPTWGAVSGIDYFDYFDTNHLAFVIKGLDSERPFPAGSYKLDHPLEGKDIQVEFTGQLDESLKPLATWVSQFNQSVQEKGLRDIIFVIGGGLAAIILITTLLLLLTGKRNGEDKTNDQSRKT